MPTSAAAAPAEQCVRAVGANATAVVVVAEHVVQSVAAGGHDVVLAEGRARVDGARAAAVVAAAEAARTELLTAEAGHADERRRHREPGWR